MLKLASKNIVCCILSIWKKLSLHESGHCWPADTEPVVTINVPMNLRLFQVLLQNNWGIWVVGVRAAKFAPRFEKSRSSHSVMLFTSHANFLWLSSPFLKRRENNLLIFEPWLQFSADVDNKKRKRNFLWVKRYACLPVPCVCVCARPFYSTLQFAEKLRIVCWGFVTLEIAIWCNGQINVRKL